MSQTSNLKSFDQIFKEKTSSQKVDVDMKEEDKEEVYLYQENHINSLFGNEPGAIMEQLLKNKPAEEGGLTAIHGFYYQMLVVIEYMCEAIQGKWSFLSIEYHDDIVVGNEAENKVRFIQVKTSTKPALSISDGNIGIYNRKIGKQAGPSNGKLRNNSWLDKMMDSSKFTKDRNSILEFDLVTDYSIYPTTQIDIQVYNKNERNKEIVEGDAIYQRLQGTCYDSEGVLIEYETRYGKTLSQLLGNICFIEKPKANFYLGFITTRLNETLGEGIRIDESDVNWLVGELISKCSNRDSGPILFLDVEEIESIRQQLKSRAVSAARPTIYKTDATELLNRCMTNILSEISNGASKSELEHLMKEYKDIILENISEVNTIQSYLKRFVNGERPDFGDDEKDYFKDLVTFVTTSFLMYLIHEKLRFSSAHKSLLVKEAFTEASEEVKIGFLNLGLELDEDEGIELLTEIIKKSSDEEQLELLWRNKSFYTIFHGASITLNNSKVVELNPNIKPKVEELENGLKSTEVGSVVTIIPEKPFKDLYTKVRRTENLNEFRVLINEKWKDMKGSEEHG